MHILIQQSNKGGGEAGVAKGVARGGCRKKWSSEKTGVARDLCHPNKYASVYSYITYKILLPQYSLLLYLYLMLCMYDYVCTLYILYLSTQLFLYIHLNYLYILSPLLNPNITTINGPSNLGRRIYRSVSLFFSPRLIMREGAGCSLNIVFISKEFRILRTLTFICFPLVSVCVYTHQAGRKPALQQSSEKLQNFKEKTQYLMNTLQSLSKGKRHSNFSQ